MPAHTDNAVVIAADLDTVWTMTNDVAGWPTLFSEYAAAEILEADERRLLFRLTTVPDADGSVWSWVSERFPDRENAVATARRVETGPFEYMNLRWDYREVPGGVEMRWRQEFTMKAGFRFDDDHMTERLNRTSREQMAHIKDVIESRVAVSA